MKITKREASNFQKAKKASEFGSFWQCQMGAVIFYGNKVLSVGWNTNKEILLQRKYNSLRKRFNVAEYPNYAHAEMLCLHKFLNTYDIKNIDTSKLSIYVWRGKDAPKLAKPCIACETALRDFGIRHVYYTGNNSFVYENLLRGE